MADAKRILVRRDTAANWVGVVPANGEPIGIIGTDGKVTAYKIGDGVTSADQLPALSKGDRGAPGDTGAQGLPGVNAVDNDAAVAGYVSTSGASSTKTALDARYAVSPSGYDIVILAGQSNMSGRGTPFASTTDPVHPLVFQYGNSGAAKNTITPASEPLLMHDTPSGIGPGLQFARWYAARALKLNRKILLVPVAHGGTPLSSNSTLGWRRGVAGNLYANMVAQAQGALAAAGADSRIVAALWLQGETDGDANTTGSQYQTDFDALVNGLRTDLGISALPFVVGTMVPEYLSTGTRAAINAVHRDTPNRISKTDVAVSATGQNLGDGNHFNAAGQRYNGRAMFDAFERIANGLLPYSETPPAPVPVQVLGLSGAAQAYSLRKVSSAGYTGKAVRVRRSSDDTTSDIGFTSGALDTASLLSFAGSGDAFVVTWFDQSGNGRDITQTTASKQPKIVAAGAVVTSGGKPAVTFDGADDILLNTAPVLFAAGAASACVVVSAANPGTQKRMWAEASSSSSTQQYGLQQPDVGNSAAMPVMTTAFASTDTTKRGTLPTFNGAIHQLSAIDTGATLSQWLDTATDLNAAAYTRPSETKDRFAVGGVSRSGSEANFAMTLSELTFWPAALSTADRQSVEASQKSFYGTP